MQGQQLTPQTAQSSDVPRDMAVSMRTANYMLFLLYLTYVLNFLDRQLISIVLTDVKRELGLTDGQLGLASGTAFAILYTLSSMPMAYMADRYNRVRLLTVCTGVWSLMTALCGLVVGFWQLVFARMGVAVFEAGGQPSSLSLIASLFPERMRAAKLSIYFSAGATATMLSYGVGGYINAIVGWRWTFGIFGLLGTVLALVIILTARDPRSGAAKPEVDESQEPFLRSIWSLWGNRLFVYVCIGCVLANISLYTILTWGPSLASRNFDVTTDKFGPLMGMASGGLTIVFVLMSGRVADYLFVKNPRFPLLFVASFMMLLAFSISMMLNAAALPPFILFFSVSFAVGSCYAAPAIAAVQRSVPNRLIAVSSTFIFMFCTLAGMGVGPVLVGVLSDLLQPEYGKHSLNMATYVAIPITLVAGLMFWLGSRHCGTSGINTCGGRLAGVAAPE